MMYKMCLMSSGPIFNITWYNQWTKTDTLLATRVLNLLTFPSFFPKIWLYISFSVISKKPHYVWLLHLSPFSLFLVTGCWTLFLLDDLDSFEVCWSATLWSVFIMKFIVHFLQHCTRFVGFGGSSIILITVYQDVY